MVMLCYILIIMLAFTAADARARSAGFTLNNWSVLSLRRLNGLPPPLRASIEKAQHLCSEEDIRVRNGYLRYLIDPSGDEVVTINFDQFHCNSAALCSSQGCLHRVFVSHGGNYREVWQGIVREIDMEVNSGHVLLHISCESTQQTHCPRELRLTGKRGSLKDEPKKA
jgi:hypothetical protein